MFLISNHLRIYETLTQTFFWSKVLGMNYSFKSFIVNLFVG